MSRVKRIHITIPLCVLFHFHIGSTGSCCTQIHACWMLISCRTDPDLSLYTKRLLMYSKTLLGFSNNLKPYIYFLYLKNVMRIFCLHHLPSIWKSLYSFLTEVWYLISKWIRPYSVAYYIRLFCSWERVSSILTALVAPFIKDTKWEAFFRLGLMLKRTSQRIMQEEGDIHKLLSILLKRLFTCAQNRAISLPPLQYLSVAAGTVVIYSRKFL